MSLSDAEIMQRVRLGRIDAFEQLVERYRPRLHRFAAQMFGDPSLAEDLVQEALTSAFAARGSFNPEFAFSTWLWTILLNVCRRERRRRRSLRRTLENAARLKASTESDDTTAAYERREDADRLREFLEHLPAAQGDALRLRFFGELSFDEIAAAMDSSVSGAKSRVKKGLAALALRMTSPAVRPAVPSNPVSDTESPS